MIATVAASRRLLRLIATRTAPFTSRGLPTALLVALFVQSAACHEPPVDDVPLPDGLLDKAIFAPDKTWILQQTVVSAGPSAPMHIGAPSFPETIRFEIQEGYLVLKRANSLVVADTPEYAGIEQQDQPIAVYPILGHYDVINGQVIQPQKSNWHDRGYMVVDFSKSLLKEVLFFEGLTPDPVSFWISENGTEESPTFSSDYIEVFVHRYFPFSTGQNPVSGEPQACSSIAEFMDCASLDVGIRVSLLRMDNREPMDKIAFDDPDFPAAFTTTALFQTNVVSQTPFYGVTNGTRTRRPFRYNIWEKAFDSTGAPIPFRDRAVRKIAFHVNAEMPERMRDAVGDALAAWNPAFTDTVRALRTWECVDEGGAEDACRAAAEAPGEVLVFCRHTPVEDGDDAACGAPGTIARSGDLRYNLIDWVTHQVAGQPSAVAWWTADLVTAETVHGDIKIGAGSFMEAIANYRDEVLYLTGRGELASDVDRLLQFQARQAGPSPAAISHAPRAALTYDDLDRAADRAMRFASLRDSAVETGLLDMEDRVVRDDGAGGLREGPSTVATSPVREPYSDLASALMKPTDASDQVAFDVDLPDELDASALADEFRDSTPEEIADGLFKRWAVFVLMHELGHVFGLKHNFAGSFDALNFHPQYWDARRRDCGPRWTCPYLQSEREGNLTGSALSTVMEYTMGANAISEIGPFDRAAIAAVYGKMATAFTDPSLSTDADARPLLDALWGVGLNPVPVIAERDASRPEGHRFRGFHYSDYPAILGDLSNRTLVPGQRFLDDVDRRVDDSGRVAVPFQACEESLVGIFPQCAPYDMGADAYEVVQAEADWYDATLALATFRRGRLSWNPARVASSIHRRVFAPMRVWNGVYAQLGLEYGDLQNGMADDPGLFEPLAVASDVSFDFLGRVLATPSSGPHYLSDAYDGTQVLVPPAQRFFAPDAEVDAVADLPVPFGRPYASVYDPTSGSVDNIGSFIEKQYALETLFEPLFVEFPGRITWDPADLFMVSFANTHRAALLRLVGAVVANDWTGLAPRYAAESLTYPNYAAGTDTAVGTRVSPTIGYNMRLRVLTWSLALTNGRSTDRTFFDRFRIFDVGSAEDVPNTRPRVTFDDVESGRTLAAVSFDDGGQEVGIGARVLARLALLDALRADGTASFESHAQRERDFQQQLELAYLIRDVVPNIESASAVPR